MENTIPNIVSSPNNFGEREDLIVNNRKLPILTVSGSDYDMGVWLGRLLGKEILEESTKAYHYLIKKLLAGFRRKRTPFDIRDTFATFIPQIPRELYLEMQGFYAGCREAGYTIAEKDLFEKLYVIVELGERSCTMFAAQQPKNNLGTLHFQIIDFYSNLTISYIPVVCIRIPQNPQGQMIDYAFADIQFAMGLIGRPLTGVNEQGVAISSIRGHIHPEYCWEGQALGSILQTILRKTNSAPQAIREMQKIPRCAAYYLIVSDPHQTKDSLQLIFMSPAVFHAVPYGITPDLSLITKEELRKYHPEENLVYWCQVEAGLVDKKPTIITNDHFHQLLTQKPLTIEATQDVAKNMGIDSTILSAIYQTNTLELWVAFADKKIPGHRQPYFHIDLKKYFSYKNRLEKAS